MLLQHNSITQNHLEQEETIGKYLLMLPMTPTSLEGIESSVNKIIDKFRVSNINLDK